MRDRGQQLHVGDGDVGDLPLGVPAADEDEVALRLDLLALAPNRALLPLEAGLLHVGEDVDLLGRRGAGLGRGERLRQPREEVRREARDFDRLDELLGLVAVVPRHRAEHDGAVGARDDLHGGLVRQRFDDRRARLPSRGRAGSCRRPSRPCCTTCRRRTPRRWADRSPAWCGLRNPAARARRPAG